MDVHGLACGKEEGVKSVLEAEAILREKFREGDVAGAAKAMADAIDACIFAEVDTELCLVSVFNNATCQEASPFGRIGVSTR